MPEAETLAEGASLEWLDWLTIGLGVVCLGLLAWYLIDQRYRNPPAEPSEPDRVDDPASSED
jgi:hypothetical protein